MVVVVVVVAVAGTEVLGVVVVGVVAAGPVQLLVCRWLVLASNPCSIEIRFKLHQPPV